MATFGQLRSGGQPADRAEHPFYMGNIVGYVQEYSDSLLKFLLEAKRPAIYRARNISVMPPDGGDGVLEIRWKEPESPQEQQPPDS